MLIDCTTCVARHVACDDCVITVLLATPPPATRPAPSDDRPRDPLDLDDADRAAIGNLASAGLVPPLRLVAALPAPDQHHDRELGEDPDTQMSGNDREIA